MTVKDLGSTNGTFVDGTPISESKLEDHNRLQIGKMVLKVDFKDASEEAFILYYLKWDHDYWLSKSAALREGKTIGPVFNSDKHYGTIKVVKGDYQRCVFAARVDDAIYMMTGKAESSEKDICDTEAEIWESRDTY